VNDGFWQDRKVLVTGHTGFKGAWLSLWLARMGAQVVGYAQPPPTTPSLFELVGLSRLIRSEIGDIREGARLKALLGDFAPEIVFHLAAQSLVGVSYEDPVETYESNVLGTVQLLDAVRRTSGVGAVVVVTSDKCYENREWEWGYREDDRLGGRDPYSSSKACAELVVASFRASFFQDGPSLATVRAGNVIGGGDWATDRLIPDMVRAGCAGEAIRLRCPEARRPWQHVFEPLRGYLQLAERLCTEGRRYEGAWNFGPPEGSARTVEEVVRSFGRMFGGGTTAVVDRSECKPETRVLRLDSSRARDRLGWRPALKLTGALQLTANWYRVWREGGKDMENFSRTQIDQYCNALDSAAVARSTRARADIAVGAAEGAGYGR